ncbi:uncharacterized protein VTP21DRAFT_8779 [Calcarisporiella thermophila]|uniref:uncharacterized protein n=1 Tax=Calcarisporiella thermophila TaxID=911321 RepID=UPI0037441AF9
MQSHPAYRRHSSEPTISPLAQIHSSLQPRRQPLETLDQPETLTWKQIRTVLISSVGFFTDAYDIFIMNLAVPMLGYVYFANNNGKMPASIEGPLKGMVTFGSLIGQIMFGCIGDAYGRKMVYGVELIIIVVSTLFCATSASTVRGLSAISFLFFWRFVLGVGIGGDYPMSATITSEWAIRGRRGQMMAVVFSMQGIGNFVASLVTVLLLLAFRGAIEADQFNIDYVWRMCIGLGAVPSMLTVYQRLVLPETPRYAVDVLNDMELGEMAYQSVRVPKKQWKKMQEKRGEQRQDQEKPQSQLTPREAGGEFRAEPEEEGGDDRKKRRASHRRCVLDHFGRWANLRVLIGTAGTWFLLDVAFYGLSLNQAFVLNATGFAGGDDPWNDLFRQAVGNLIISVLGAIPGYITSVFLIERIGRKPIQYIGFIMLAVIFLVLSIFFRQIHNNTPALFVVLFAFLQFFFNFGPNTTTFVLPGEVFPTRLRATSHGISAAFGKLGAIVSTFGFNSLVEHGGAPGQHAFLPQTLGIFAVVMLLGAALTPLIPETCGKDLDYFEKDHAREWEELGWLREAGCIRLWRKIYPKLLRRGTAMKRQP